MEGKQRELLGIISKLLFAIIVAISMIIAARIFSNAIADRPLVGSFNGSLSQSNFGDDELMDVEELRDYLSMYPTEYETSYYSNGSPISGYDFERRKMRDELQRNITSGT
jgi:hypothetical protein